MEASCELAEKLGPYETYEGSPVSKGVRTGSLSSCPCVNSNNCHSNGVLYVSEVVYERFW